ncbi:hypothetical protein ACUWC2_28885, partial [Klebsiella pneumoniae]|uniref:hypothetical protein n=1 Tax=Klebsiella pneumoniae TaxID=573 RepID=UPI0040554DCA
ERTTIRERKGTPSPIKDLKTFEESKKPSFRSSPERSIKKSVDRMESEKGFEERRTSTDKNGSTIQTVRSYTSPDKSYSLKELS